MNSEDKKKLIDFLRQVEGERFSAYKDSAGLWTIGVGHLITEEELLSGYILIGEKLENCRGPLTVEQRDTLLLQDLAPIIGPGGALEKYIKVDLSPHQFIALASFIFNFGVGAFRRSTLLKKVNEKAFNEVPGQFLRWIYAGKKIIPGLVNRRRKEIGLWETS